MSMQCPKRAKRSLSDALALRTCRTCPLAGGRTAHRVAETLVYTYQIYPCRLAPPPPELCAVSKDLAALLVGFALRPEGLLLIVERDTPFENWELVFALAPEGICHIIYC